MYFAFEAITLPLGCSIFCTRAECMFCIQIKVYLQFMQYSISFLTYMYMQFSGMCTGWKIWLHLAFIVASLKGYSTPLSRVTCAPHIGNNEGFSPGSSIALGGGGGGRRPPPIAYEMPPPGSFCRRRPPLPDDKDLHITCCVKLKSPDYSVVWTKQWSTTGQVRSGPLLS